MLLVVDAKHHTCAEEILVGVSVGGPVVVLLVPQTLGRNADPLSSNLTDDGLDDNLVAGHVQFLDTFLDVLGDLLTESLSLLVHILLVLEFVEDALFNAVSDLRNVKPEKS